MSKIFAMLTLRSSCGAIGQRTLGSKTPMSWSTEAFGHTVEAVLTGVDKKTHQVGDVVIVTADTWREIESNDLERDIVEAIEDGQTIEAALEHVTVSY